ncbi:immunoglobulin-like domain-containing protein [Halobacillus sp. K22]|uniref:immunoglobulin-like domain-containing protein n=1 Tax=Halobacillus sp. K22 TaxID=3457431 RepID=UPI003FCEC003
MKKVLFLFTLLLFLVGCSSLDPRASSSGSIPSQIGDSSSGSELPDFKEWTTEKINEQTGYEPYTNEFFKGIYLTTTFHMVEPGKTVGTHESFPNQKIRVQLVERKRDLEKIKMVEEKVLTDGEKLRVQLPQKTDVLYTYSQEAIGENDEVLDTDVAVFYVPPEEFNARMYTGKDVYQEDDSLEVNVENWGPTLLQFGKPYVLEKYHSGSWRNASGSQAFEDIGYRLEPQNTFTQQIDLGSFSLSSGRYRVVKTFHAAHTEISVQLATEFEVE